MDIKTSGVFVENQAEALAFYTEILGFSRAPLSNSMVALRSLKHSYARRVSPLMAIPLARSATPQMDA